MVTSPTRRTASVPIYNGDDLEQLADLRRAAENARRARDNAPRSAPQRLGDPEAATELGEAAGAAERAYDEFVVGAADRATLVRLQALPRKTFRRLMLDNPPRRVTDPETNREVEHEEDAPYGVNVEDFPEALLAYREGPGDDDERTMLEPALESVLALQKFLDGLSDGDFERLWQLAYSLNRAAGGDPKELAYSPDRVGLTAT
jgi:hypothetical protein